MANILKKIVDSDKRELKKFEHLADKVEALADDFAALTDEQLQHHTVEYKERLAKGETLDDLLPDRKSTRLNSSH